MTSQFVACACISCPMNTEKSCRAPFIMLDQKGECIIKGNSALHDDKAITESYVEIRDCQCKKCNYWEKNEAMSTDNVIVGDCGLRSNLFFQNRNDKALCSDFEKQISEPGFTAVL